MARSHTENVSQRLRRIEGQIRGILKMMDEQRSCEEVITQVLAARAAMDKVATEILTNHVDECLRDLPTTGATERISRAVHLIDKVF